MSFLQFAEMHGLVISSLIMDRWVRVPTHDKPSKKNGAYIFDGISGAVRNWAVHDKALSWRSQEPYRPDPLEQAKKEKHIKDRLDRQVKAKKKAGFIFQSAIKATHPYLKSKGFDDKGYVWNGLLVIPMRLNGDLVGCQLIAQDGTKRFLTGQVTKGASLKIDNKGRDILCEGYATGLSIRRAMRELKERYTIHICFSASNMLEISKKCPSAIVIADNDTSGTGLRTAKKIGDRYWISDVVGEDANDYEKRLGTLALSQSLLKVL